jgi:MFS family permease
MNSNSRSLASPLGNRHLYLAQLSALTGTGVMTVGLALLAYQLAGENAGAVLGMALSLRIVAFVLISPLFGAYAHLLPRRRVLVALDLVRAATVLLLPFVDAVWHVYALIFVINAASAGFTPLFQATIPDVLPDEAVYTRALSLSRLAYDLQQLLAPAIAGLLLWFLPLSALFAVNGAAFLVSAALVLSLRLPGARKVTRPEGVLANIGWGIRLYLATPRLQGLLALSMAVAAATAMVIVNTVVYVRDVLGGSDMLVTVAYAGSGGGSMLAALLLPRVLDRTTERSVMLAGGALMAVGMAAGMLMPALAGLLAIWLLIGVGSSLVQTPGGRLLRRSSHEEDRPALFAAQFALSHACWLVTYLVAGVVGNEIGLFWTFGVLGLLVVVSTGLAMRLWPAVDPEVLDHEHAPLRHEHTHTHDEHHQHEHEGWEGPQPHRHSHRHVPLRHRHAYVVDYHHLAWPKT